jgi:hypothetical protein
VKLLRILISAAPILALSAAFTLYSNHSARSSDHQDSPATLNRPGADITDPYIFPSPVDPTKVVVVMNVHPLISSGQGLITFFDPGVLYQMKFDNVTENGAGGAPKENLVIQFIFGAPGVNQQVSVYGPASPATTGAANTVLPILGGAGTINAPFMAGRLKVFAGAREDSFFFDLAQFLKILPDRNGGSTAPSCLPAKLGGNGTCPQGFNPTGTATDTLRGFNVLSIVVEMPRALLRGSSGSKIAFWTTTGTANGN